MAVNAFDMIFMVEEKLPGIVVHLLFDEKKNTALALRVFYRTKMNTFFLVL